MESYLWVLVSVHTLCQSSFIVRVVGGDHSEGVSGQPGHGTIVPTHNVAGPLALEQQRNFPEVITLSQESMGNVFSSVHVGNVCYTVTLYDVVQIEGQFTLRYNSFLRDVKDGRKLGTHIYQEGALELA